MSFRLAPLLASRAPEKFSLYERYISAHKVKSLHQLGFERDYVRAEGCELFDRAGDSYLDCDGGNGVFALGRNHPCIRETLLELLNMRPANWAGRDAPLLASLLAEALVQRLPDGLTKFLFTSTGSETAEAALKFARRATGRPRFLYLEGGFHGLTYGALSITDSESRLQPIGKGFGPMLPGCTAIPRNDLGRLEEALSRGDVAALFVEPIQGASVHAMDENFLSGAQALCHAHGALLIVDEILTGLGRTGSFLATGQMALRPDMVLLAKALSGGVMPVGALIVREELYHRVFAEPGAFVHGSTFGENDYGMAAALATIHTVGEENLIENAAGMGAILLAELRRLQERFEVIAEVRGRGLLIGLELRAPGGLLGQSGAALVERRGLLGHLMAMMLVTQHRILAAAPARNNVLRLHPPLIIREEQIRAVVAAIEAVLEQMDRFPEGIGRVLLRRLVALAQ